MAQPTQSDVHVDKVLTNISLAYIQNQTHFVASKVFPIIPVDKASDKYYVYTKADWFRDEAQKRADATESAGSGYGVTTDSYSCDTFAFHKDIGDQVRQNTDAPLDPDRDATQFVTQRLLLRQEIQWASDYFTTSVWGTDVVGGTNFTRWSDYTASDPIEDIEAGKETILKNTGFMPNTLVLGYSVYRKLKHHPDIVDRLKYTAATTSRSVTTETLAALFDVERVLVAMAIKNTGLEGETASYSFTHGSNALLCYTAPNPGLLTPSAGYIFAWRGVSDGMGATVGVGRFRMPQLRADRVEGQTSFDDKVVATDLGYFFSSAVS